MCTITGSIPTMARNDTQCQHGHSIVEQKVAQTFCYPWHAFLHIIYHAISDFKPTHTLRTGTSSSILSLARKTACKTFRGQARMFSATCLKRPTAQRLPGIITCRLSEDIAKLVNKSYNNYFVYSLYCKRIGRLWPNSS